MIHDVKKYREACAVLGSAQRIFDPAEVSNALDIMAADITLKMRDDDPVVLAVMKGGAYTAVELCRRMRFPFQFDFVHGSRYEDSMEGGKLTWPVPPSPALAGRTVLVVDDILDRGETLEELYRLLEAVGASQIYGAVLVSKGVAETPVDFLGLSIEDRFVFGCGMDYKGYWRGETSLYLVKEGGRDGTE